MILSVFCMVNFKELKKPGACQAGILEPLDKNFKLLPDDKKIEIKDYWLDNGYVIQEPGA